MAKYRITAPDGGTYEVTAPDDATQEQVLAYAQANYKTPAKAEPSMLDSIKQGAGNFTAGLVRGAGSIGATLLAPVDIAADAIAGKGLTLESNRQRRADMDAALASAGAETDSVLYGAGKLVGEIAGTAGAGGAIANAARVLPGAARAAPLLESIASGGMRAGGLTGVAGQAVRAAGGAVAGGAAAGLTNPEDFGTGAVIGAAAPGVIQAAGAVGRGIGGAYRSLRTPKDTAMVNRLLQVSGLSRDEVLAALSQQGPQMIPGYQATVPQILQNPVVSQLQRTAKTAGGQALGDAERLQQVQMRQALDRIAPAANTVNEAADAAGSAIQRFAMPAREAASTRVRAAFDAVDPFDETALYLPLDDMRGAVSKYLGPGTFGTGSKAREAVRTAEEVGTVALDGIKAAKAAPEETLLQAVKRAGINPNALSSKQFAGELRDLRQSPGMNRLVSGKGQSLSRVAETMRERGFIPDEDPATLLNALREGGNQTVTGSGDDAMRAALERSMGDAPGTSKMAQTVPFRTVQSLRSSIGEAAEQASAKGANKEAAALRQMVSDIDSRINRAAGGSKEAGEFFPQDIANQYREALNLHAEKMRRFETGPQAGIFRKGGDGQASIQGAEIPPKFYSGRGSQVEDVQAFRRLIGDRQELAQAMKSYAMTEGQATANQAGDLTSKFTKWMASRSGANKELFTAQELATLKEVGKAVERSINAENLGRVAGSDTAQKLASLQSNGVLDSRLVDLLANRIPGVSSFSGPMLSGLRETAGRDRNRLLSELLANPERFSQALQSGKPSSNRLLQLAGQIPLEELATRSAPVIGAQ